MKGHKHRRHGPTCPMGGFHQVGAKFIVTWIEQSPVFGRQCSRCGTLWAWWPDQMTVWYPQDLPHLRSVRLPP